MDSMVAIYLLTWENLFWGSIIYKGRYILLYAPNLDISLVVNLIYSNWVFGLMIKILSSKYRKLNTKF